jgi:DNA-binding NarL/FixJ family response regulator
VLVRLVMDDGVLRQSLWRMLAEQGYRVTGPSSGPTPSRSDAVDVVSWPSELARQRLDEGRSSPSPAPVVALTDHDDDVELLDVVHRGAIAVVPSRGGVSLLVTAIEQAALGYATLPRGLIGRVAALVRAGTVDETLLADDERRWLHRLASNTSLTELARTEGYSDRHLRRLLNATYTKLGVTNRAAALVRAGELGVLEPAGTTDR